MSKFISKNKEYFIFGLIVALFILLRIPALNTPYHQDEYKWPLYAEAIEFAPGSVPHPPLTEFIYQLTGDVFGLNNFRVTPFIFSIANLFLLFIFVKRRYGFNVGIISSLFFTVSYFGLLSSAMVDTDGTILPFFLLLSLIFYDLAKESSKRTYLYIGLMCLSMFLGILVKLSFIIGIGAIILDFVWDKKEELDRKKIFVYLSYLVGFVVFVVASLFVAQYVFTGFSLSKGLHYWETFMRGFTDRNFFQTFIQFCKALLYSSPLFILLFSFSFYPYKKELKFFHIFVSLGLVFYLVLFDFSIGALDRYLQFLVIPFSVVSAKYIFDLFNRDNSKIKSEYVLLGLIIFVSIFATQFMDQAVPPLHPKSEWIDRILSLRWNFLYPFSGGSGPLPFYISWNFIALSSLFSTFLAGIYIFKKNFRKEIIIILSLGFLIYNFVFIQEYLFGNINGSTKRLTISAVSVIKNNPDIKEVLVYNDNGGWEVRRAYKYFRRLYAVPGFEPTYIPIFKDFKGHVLFIDAPHLGDKNIYKDFINSCQSIYTQKDKYITAQVLDCNKN